MEEYCEQNRCSYRQRGLHLEGIGAEIPHSCTLLLKIAWDGQSCCDVVDITTEFSAFDRRSCTSPSLALLCVHSGPGAIGLAFLRTVI